MKGPFTPQGIIKFSKINNMALSDIYFLAKQRYVFESLEAGNSVKDNSINDPPATPEEEFAVWKLHLAKSISS